MQIRLTCIHMTNCVDLNDSSNSENGAIKNTPGSEFDAVFFFPKNMYRMHQLFDDNCIKSKI